MHKWSGIMMVSDYFFSRQKLFEIVKNDYTFRCERENA